MTTILNLRLRGPSTVLEATAGTPLLFAEADAWQPGVYLWTFLYNHSERVHHVGAAHGTVAAAHADHVAAFLRGERPLHAAEAREAGLLRRVYAPGDGIEAFLAHAADLGAELRALRVFHVPVTGADPLRGRIVAAIARHILNLGGKALDWFAAGARDPVAPVVPNAEALTVRFYRPVHMASMPDELSV